MQLPNNLISSHVVFEDQLEQGREVSKSIKFLGQLNDPTTRVCYRSSFHLLLQQKIANNWLFAALNDLYERINKWTERDHNNFSESDPLQELTHFQGTWQQNV